MGVLVVIICGFLGIVVACKKNFLESWIFLVNLAMATYLALFLTPVLIPLLEQVPVARELKVGGGALVLTFCLTWLLHKITEQVAPESGLDISIPSLANRIASMAAGFLCGILLVTWVLFIFVKLPFSSSFSCRNDLEKSAQAVLMRNIKIINVFSSQTLSANGQKALQQMMILPAPPAKSSVSSAESKSAESKSAEPKSKVKSSKVNSNKGVKTSATPTKHSRVFIGDDSANAPSAQQPGKGQVVSVKLTKENGVFIGDDSENALSAKRSSKGQAVRGKSIKKNGVFIGDSPLDTPAVKSPVPKKDSVGSTAPVARSGVFIGDDSQEKQSASTASASTAKIDSAEVKTSARQNSSGMSFLSLDDSMSEK